MQRIHKILAIISFVFLLIMSLAGIGLGYESVYYRMIYGDYSAYDSVWVGDVMRAVSALETDAPITSITTPARGIWVASWEDGTHKTIHPITGIPLDDFKKDVIFEFISSIHTHVFLGKVGKYITVMSSLFLTIISITGLIRAVQKQGGWRGLIKINSRDSVMGQIHTLGGAIVCVPIVILATTGFITGVLHLMKYEPRAISVGGLESNTEKTFIGYANMDILQRLHLHDVTEIIFPIFDDAYDVISVKTNTKTLYLDRYDGTQVGADIISRTGKIVKTLRMLHTTNQNPVWMFVWFMASVAICVLVVTGGVLLIRRWDRQQYATDGDIVILYASQNGRTKQFVHALYMGIKTAGVQSVGVRTLNHIHKVPTTTKAVVIMTSTYGDGDAPDMAKGVLSKIQSWQSDCPHAVIGFGDKSFLHFCGFAKCIAHKLDVQNVPVLMQACYIDNASLVEFKDSVQKLGTALGYKIPLDINVLVPKTDAYVVTSVQHYDTGHGKMALIKIQPPDKTKFQAGDIFGVLYEHQTVRFYSIASSHHTQQIVLSVRVIGLVSGYLSQLRTGDTVQGFIRHNPAFHAPKSVPLILLGIGSGVAPLYGILQHISDRQVQAFFGYTTPEGNPFTDLQGDNIHIAYSRASAEKYQNNATHIMPYYGVRIPDVIRQNKDIINRLIHQQAVIMMCGSKHMEHSVIGALQDVLDDPDILSDPKRLLKDTY